MLSSEISGQYFLQIKLCKKNDWSCTLKYVWLSLLGLIFILSTHDYIVVVVEYGCHDRVLIMLYEYIPVSLIWLSTTIIQQLGKNAVDVVNGTTYQGL